MSIRSELKLNVLASRLERVLTWGLEYKVPILVGVIFLILSALIGSVVVLREREKRDINWTRLAQAQGLIAEKRFDLAEQVLGEVLTSAPNSSAAHFAVYYQGLVALELSQSDQAIQHFSSLIGQLNKEPLRPLVLSNLGFAYEQKGDYGLAAQTYRDFMDRYSDHFLAARTQLYLGQSLKRVGDMEGANQALGHLIDLYPASPWADKARKLLDNVQTR